MSVLGALCALAAPARAAPLAASVQAISTNAEKAYGAGQYDRSSELFEQAWKAAPGETTLLYNSARAAQMAKLWDRAEALYVQYLALKDHDPKFLDKANLYLPDVRAARTAQKGEEAKAKAKDGDALQRDKRYREAATAYRDAWRLLPENLEYLFRAGAAAALGCDDMVARPYLNDYLQKAPADAPDRVEAQARLAGIDKTCRDGRQVSESEHVVKTVEEHSVRNQPTAGGSYRTLGLWTAIGGGVVAGVGGVLFGMASADNAAFQADMAPGLTGRAVKGGWTEETAKAKKAALESSLTTGAIVTGVGVVAALAGGAVWYLSPDSAAVAAALAPDRVMLTYRF